MFVVSPWHQARREPCPDAVLRAILRIDAVALCAGVLMDELLTRDAKDKPCSVALHSPEWCSIGCLRQRRGVRPQRAWPLYGSQCETSGSGIAIQQGPLGEQQFIGIDWCGLDPRAVSSAMRVIAPVLPEEAVRDIRKVLFIKKSDHATHGYTEGCLVATQHGKTLR